MMNLDDLGYTAEFEKQRQAMGLAGLTIARISEVHKERYTIKTEKGEYDAEILGSMRFSAAGKADFPAIGDWVAVQILNSESAVIQAILPRRTVIERQVAGKTAEKQIIAANVDVAFIIQAADRDFNLARLERYLTVVNTARVQPVIILSKVDLPEADDLEAIHQQIAERIKQVPVISYSDVSGAGFSAIQSLLESRKTYCFLGSSGVGKSTLINRLAGKNLLKTGSISDLSNRGKHVTSHRSLIILANGSIVIDNPGMREIGLTDTTEGLQKTFDKIIELSRHCWFSDCSHTHEQKCAVKEAVAQGEIDPEAFDNYIKMEAEKKLFTNSFDERRKKDKSLAKIRKDYHKQQRKKR